MKLGLAAASLILVAGGAVGCGATTAAVTVAATADKGAVEGRLLRRVPGLLRRPPARSTGEEEDLGEILKKAAKKIEDVGTPEDIPDDAKDGLEVTLDAIEDLPDDASAEDMAGLESELSEDDKKKIDAFSDYLDKTCPDVGCGELSPAAVGPNARARGLGRRRLVLVVVPAPSAAATTGTWGGARTTRRPPRTSAGP